MNTKLKNLTMAVAVGMAYCGSALAFPAFQNNGVGPAIEVKSYDAAVGNYLLNDFNPALLAAGSPMEFLGQSVINNFNPSGGGPGLTAAAGFEYTLVMAVPMIMKQSAGGTVTATVTGPMVLTCPAVVTPVGYSCTGQSGGAPVGASDSPQTYTANFFEIYYSSTAGALKANLAAGTGFADGTLVLQGHIVDVIPGNASAASAINIPQARNAADTAIADLVADPNAPPAGSVSTIQANGSSRFNIEIDYSNPAFWPGSPSFLVSAFVIDPAKPQLTDPNTAGDPASTSFAGVIPAVGTPDYGADTVADSLAANPLSLAPGQPLTNTVNNYVCQHLDPITLVVTGNPICDFSATGAQPGALDATAIPEPGSVALLGLGLVGLYGLRRRKSAR